jgi:hypothetical protein
MIYEQTVSVANIPCDIQEQELSDHFSPAGGIQNILVHRDVKTGFCSGKAYIVFDNQSSVTVAVAQLGSVKLAGKTGNPVLLVIKPAAKDEESDIVTFLSKASVSSHSDSLDDFLNQLSPEDIDKLADRIKAKLSTSKQNSILSQPVKYQISQKPRLPLFSGDSTSKDIPYYQWRHHVDCLLNNPAYSDSDISDAIRFSVKGTAAEISLCIGPNAKPSEILDQFDISFGDVSSKSLLREQFFSAKRSKEESMVAWHTRLKKLMHSAQLKGAISTSEAEDCLRSRFWWGINNERIHEALRVDHNNKVSMNSLLASARGLEEEYSDTTPNSSTASNSKTSRSVSNLQALPSKKISQQQAQEPTLSDVMQAFKDFSKKVDHMESRLTKVEHQQRNNHRGPPSGQQQEGSKFCERCKRKNHTIQDCVARHDIYGQRLN